MARKIRILLIDDDPAQCETLADILADHDCDVEPCWDATRAEALGCQHVFDLVLLDLKLTGIDGLELLRRIHANGHGCLMVLTGVAEAGIKREALADGADAVLEKPVDIPRLLDIAQDIRQTGDCKETARLVPVP